MGDAVRRVWLCALVTFLAAAHAQAQTGATPNLAEGPGCLGVPVAACVKWLQSTMKLDEGFIAAAMARRQRVDVNGKPLGGDLMTLSGKLPGHLEPMLMVLHIAPDDTVKSAEASLLQNLVAARTEQDYDRSALYDIAARLLGRRCPGLAKLDLYRFFENTVKPRIATQRRDVSAGLNGLHRLIMQSAALPYCSASFTYKQQIEWHGSAEPVAGRNVTGHAAIELQ